MEEHDVPEQVEPVDLLAIGAHPDDVEYGMGGTLVRHHHVGHRIGVVDLTRGELGSKGDPQRRADEAHHAAEVYGARFRTCLDLGDTQVDHAPDPVRRLAAVIRAARPRVVASHQVADRHPDYRAAHELVRRAVFAAALSSLDLGVAHHVVDGVVSFPTDRVIAGDLYIDVSDVWDERRETMHRFASQFTAPTRDIDHRLYGIDDYLEVVTTRARAHGQRIGVRYAEAFVTEQGVPIDDLVELFART